MVEMTVRCGRSNAALLGWSMTKKREPVDDLLDALIWMRRKAKKHEPVDYLIDALVRMRRKAKRKATQRKQKTRPRR
jgi:hypothetical protein